MQTYHVMRIVLSGTAPHGAPEQFSTIVRVSSRELAACEHLGQARFRAAVRGLGAPWRVEVEYEVARTHHDSETVLHHGDGHREPTRRVVGDAHSVGQVRFAVGVPLTASLPHSKAA